MNVAVIDYPGGNTASVLNALSRLGVEAAVTDDPEKLTQADRVVFPGVGEASTAMASLRSKGLDRLIPNLRQPVLGICLGMQLLCSRSDENDTACLNIFDLKVRKFESGELKVPHIGWNRIGDLRGKLFTSVADGSHVYFVHSYYVDLSENAAATSDYGIRFTSAIEKENFFAVQFHPERSGTLGETILENFLSL